MSEFEDLKQKYRDEMQKYLKDTPQAASVPTVTPPPTTDTQNENLPQGIQSASEKGYMQIRVTALRESVPIIGASITVSKSVGEEANIIWSDVSDQNGKSDIIELPAPNRSLSESPNQNGLPYAVYNVRVEAQGFYTVYNINVQIFSGELSIVAVDMIPKKETELFTDGDMTFQTPPGNLLNT